METITPLQHQQTLSLYHTLKTQTQTSNLHLSPQNAFISLFLLNLPAPALYHYTKHHATRAAHASWPSSWNARWIAHYFPDKTPSLLASHVTSHVRAALQPLQTNLGLSHLTREHNRWWTLLTTHFTHFNLSHLLGNMLALKTVAPACLDVPGMSAVHVFGIAVVSSLATSTATLYRFRDAGWNTSWTSCGFSAVGCAFISVAALGADERVPGKARGVWSVAALQIAGDVVPLIRARCAPASASAGVGAGGAAEAVDYVGHLVGYACGAVYYAVFLWLRGVMMRGEVGGAGEEGQRGEERLSEGRIAEVLRRHVDERAADRAASSVRREEDWEEVSGKLGYAPSEEESLQT